MKKSKEKADEMNIFDVYDKKQEEEEEAENNG